MMENIKAEIITASEEETEKLGTTLGAALAPGDFVFLVGELGTGKTTLVRGICKGVHAQKATQVRSPSFTIINEYKGDPPIRHVDLYRIDGHDDFDTIGLFDSAFSGITVIEWADRIEEKSRLDPVTITLEDVSENERRILISANKSLLNSMGL